MNSSKGLTLIEFIIGSSLGLIIIAGLSSFYLKQKDDYLFQQKISRTQENGRLAIHLLQDDIREAGYIGCPKLNSTLSINNNYASTNSLISPKNRIYGTKDSVSIRKMSGPVSYLTSDMSSRSQLILPKVPKFKKDEILLISNCQNVELFRIEKIATKNGFQIITASTELHHSYNKYALVGLFTNTKFFVNKTKRIDSKSDPVYALYSETKAKGDKQNPSDQELVPGIKKIELSYGVQKNQSQDLIYQPSNQVKDWSQVESVHISLLLSELNKHWQSTIDLRN